MVNYSQPRKGQGRGKGIRDELREEVQPKRALDVVGHVVTGVLASEQARKNDSFMHARRGAPSIAPGLNDSHGVVFSQRLLHRGQSELNIYACVVNLIRAKQIANAFVDCVLERVLGEGRRKKFTIGKSLEIREGREQVRIKGGRAVANFL